MPNDDIPSLDGRPLPVLADLPDLRDRWYEPTLLDLALNLDPQGYDPELILDQGTEGACTGFALASAITLMNRLRYGRATPAVVPPSASPRMLYEMARMNDEFPGNETEGSSVRGALKGFYYNGCCSEASAPWQVGETGWLLTKDQAKDARQISLGAYYRLRPQIIDYHAALNEVGVIFVSANIHSGWKKPSRGVIRQSSRSEGGHAFLIVGYDSEGFLVQNSWGKGWGRFRGMVGIAHWSYRDWAATVMDAWVLRLAVPTPEAFDLTVSSEGAPATSTMFGEVSARAPRRDEIIGHVVHLNDGKLVQTGKYGTPLPSIRHTAELFSSPGHAKYRHLLLYAHGGLNGANASANRIRKMKEVFKRNGIYPVHFMWETGFSETLADLLTGSAARTQARVGGVSDWWDSLLETVTRGAGRAFWRDMKGDGARSFSGPKAGGWQALKLLLDGNAARGTPMKLHLVGHSAGSIFHAHLLEALDKIAPGTQVESCSLMAPACTVDLFSSAYQPQLASGRLRKLVRYNMIDDREAKDTVGPYRKSLLYLVSNAFEEARRMHLLGMEAFEDRVPKHPAHSLHFAGRAAAITDSRTHGGFDNDRKTMNHILSTVLGRKPKAADAFQDEDLTGY